MGRAPPPTSTAALCRRTSGGFGGESRSGQAPRTGLDLISMSARPITKELVQQVSDDLRTRYDLDAEDVRTLGARLAEQDLADRHDENIAFAQQFTAEHRETFDRLGQ
jgi:hypothetical protein